MDAFFSFIFLLVLICLLDKKKISILIPVSNVFPWRVWNILFYFFSPICFVTFPSYWRSLTRKYKNVACFRLGCHEPRLEEGRFWPTDHSFLEVAGKGFSGFTKKNIFGLRFFSEPSICFFHTLLLCWPLPFVVDTDLFYFLYQH